MRQVLAARPSIRRALAGGVIAAALVAIGLGTLNWRLSSGPIAISFLTDDIVAAAAQRLPAGFVLEVADTELNRHPDYGIQVGLSDVALTGPTGETVFAAPRATIGLSPWRLVTGRVSPRSLWLIEPELTVVDTEAGLRLRAATPEPLPETARVTTRPADVAAVLLALVNDGGLQSVGVRDATFTVDRDGERAAFGPVTLGMFNGRGANDLSFMAMLGSEAGMPRIQGTIVREADYDLMVEATLSDLAMTDVAAWFPKTLPVTFSSPMNSVVAFRIDGGGRLEAASAKVTVGAGHVGFGERRFLIDEADVTIDWSDATGQVSILPSVILAGGSKATVAAQVAVPDRGEFSYGTIPMRLELTDVEIGDDRGGPPAIYPSVTAEAFYVTDQSVLHISRLDVVARDAAMSFVGFAGGAGESPGIRLAGSMVPMPYDALRELWPPFLGPNTRNWVLRHLDAGTVTEGRLTVDIAPGDLAAMARGVPLPEQSYLLEFQVEDVDFRYLGDMPPITGARGHARLTPATFDLRMAQGAIVPVGESERIAVGSGRFHIADRRAQPPTGEITLSVSGSASAMMRLFDHEPISLASRRNLDPSTLGGDGALDIGLTLPLVNGVRLSDVGLTVDGTISGFSAENFSGARTVEGGEMEVRVADGRFSVTGEAVVDGVPAEIALEDSIDGQGEPGEQAVTLRLDEEARERLGIPLGDIISGPISATVADVRAVGRGTSQRIEADLTDARIAFAPLGLEKPAGERANATFQLAQEGEAIRLTGIDFQSGAIRIRGEAEFQRGGGLVSLDLPVVRTARGTDIAITGESDGAADRFTLRGRALDLRPALRGIGGRATEGAATATGGDGGRYRVAIDVEEAIGFHGESLGSVDATVHQDGGSVSRLELTGTTSTGQSVVVRFGDDGGIADLGVDTDDGGRLLAWSGLYPNMRNGRLRLAASRRGADAPLAGRLVINGFAIANDPSLQRIMESGEQDRRRGAAQGDGQSFNPSNVGFDTLSLPFIQGPAGFQVSDGVLRGPAVGATIEGQVDLGSDRLSLHGTYVPLYALNNLFGQLPIFGPLLGGKRNEGMFGVTYSLSGPVNSPVLTINPLSLVAPGVFRYILGMDNPQAFTPQSTGSSRDPSIR